MALQDYARFQVYCDGQKQTQVTSLSLRTESGNQVVNLLVEGLAGFTDGAGMCTIEIGYAIPSGGSEFPYQEKCANKEYVTMQFKSGSKVYSGTGKFQDCSENQSTSANAEGSVNWLGEVSPYDSLGI